MHVSKTGPLLGTAPLSGGTAPLPPPVAAEAAASAPAATSDLDLTTGAGQASGLTLGSVPVRPIETEASLESAVHRNRRQQPQAQSGISTELYK